MVIHLTLALSPVLLASRADKNHGHLVLCGLGVADSFIVTAMLTLDIPATCERRVLDALRIDLQILRSHREVSPVDTIVSLTKLGSFLIVVAELALEEQVAAFIAAMLLRVKHVVALGAEAHPLELSVLELARYLRQVLLRSHGSLRTEHFCLSLSDEF